MLLITPTATRGDDNCNQRRQLLGLNPLTEVTETCTVPKKTSRNTGKKTINKLKPTIPGMTSPSNHVAGLDGNQLLEAINRESDETPMKL